MSIQHEAREIQKLFDAGTITGAEMNKRIRELGTKKRRKVKPIDPSDSPEAVIKREFRADAQRIIELVHKYGHAKTAIRTSILDYRSVGDTVAESAVFEAIEWRWRWSLDQPGTELVGKYKGTETVVHFVLGGRR